MKKRCFVFLALVSILIIGWFLNKRSFLKESFRSKKRKRSHRRKRVLHPYFHRKKTLKHMISEMANDALLDKLKKGPTLINMGGIYTILDEMKNLPNKLF